MKKFELKSEEIEVAGKPMPFDYRDILLSVLGTPDSSRGFSIDDIAKACRVMDKIREADQVVELEDADWSHLVQAVKEFRWGFAHPAIVSLYRDVESARE